MFSPKNNGCKRGDKLSSHNIYCELQIVRITDRIDNAGISFPRREMQYILVKRSLQKQREIL